MRAWLPPWLVLLWVGTAASCMPSNQDACRVFVAEANREYRACGYDHLVMNREETCPEFLNLGGADCTDYYACLRQEARCCDLEEQARRQSQGSDCTLGEVDFEAMEACKGCR